MTSDSSGNCFGVLVPLVTLDLSVKRLEMLENQDIFMSYGSNYLINIRMKFALEVGFDERKD